MMGEERKKDRKKERRKERNGKESASGKSVRYGGYEREDARSFFLLQTKKARALS